jgi:polyadenylate-binding protein
VADFNREYKTKTSSNVFVKNFPEDVTARELELEFSVCGHIISSKISYDQGGKSRRYGFIQFDTAEAASKAALKNDQEWRGERLKVENFQPRDQRESLFSHSNLHICGFSQETTKAQLDALFSSFGEITSSIIQSKQVRDEVKIFGFVNFKDSVSADQAKSALNGREELGGVLKVQPHMSKHARAQFLRSEFKKKQEKWKQTNLVFNKLPPSVTEQNLRQLCQEYGNITSIKILFKSNVHFQDGAPVHEQIPTGTGFVNFENAESAERAQKALNRTQFEKQSVFVSHWKPREELMRYLRSIQARKRLPHPDMMMSFMAPYQRPAPGAFPRKPQDTRGSRPPQSNYAPMPQQPGPLRSVPHNPGMPKPIQSAPAQITISRLQETVEKLPDLKSKKQAVGEYLYPRIHSMTNPNIAGKITGMLLEMDIPELVKLSEEQTLLRKRVSEAIEVLRSAWSQDEKMRQSLELLKMKDA